MPLASQYTQEYTQNIPPEVLGSIIVGLAFGVVLLALYIFVKEEKGYTMKRKNLVITLGLLSAISISILIYVAKG